MGRRRLSGREKASPILGMPFLALAALLLAWSLPAQAAPAPATGRASLTVACDDDYPPYIFRTPQGRLQGYLPDYWRLWSARTGVAVLFKAEDWGQALHRMKAGGAEVLDTVFITPDRQAWLDFSPPYADIPVPVYVHKDIAGIVSPASLRGFRVAAKQGDACVERLRGLGVESLALYPSYEAVIAAAVSGTVKIFCVDAPPADYLLYKAGIHQDFRKTFSLGQGQLHRAVRKGDAATLALLAQGDAAIGAAAKAGLAERWLAPQAGRWDRLVRLLGIVGLAGCCLAALLLGLVWQLRRQVRQSTRQLDRERALLSTLVKTIPDLVWLKDTRGVYIICNKAFERFTGVREADIIGHTDTAIVSPEQAGIFREQDLATLQAPGPIVTEEWITFAENGRRALTETIKTAMQDGQGRVIGVLGIARDITKNRQMEEQLRQSQKLESMGRLAGGVAHDFNNMLGVILGNAELARQQAGLSQAVDESLQEIIKASQHSIQLTRQMLAFARKQQSHPKVLDLNSAVDAMFRMLHRVVSEGISLQWEPGQGLWPVLADPVQMDQVLANLVINARDAVDSQGGRIIISTANISIDAEHNKSLPMLAPGDWVRLAVEDNGSGMPPEVQAHLFEPFFTTKQVGQGTGLGLAMVYGIVKQNGGAIAVESAPGAGSRFTAYLPRAKQGAASESPAALAGGQRGAGELVYLVEDEPALLSVVRQMLLNLGYQARSAPSPLEAERDFPASGDVRLLLTDMRMPGMGGVELASRLRQARPGLKCLFMSGYAPEDPGLPGTALLSKPFTQQELGDKLRELLDRD